MTAAFFLALAMHIDIMGVKKAPPLPEPTGRVIHVKTPAQLWAAVRDVTSDTTILIAPGTYPLPNTLHFSTPGKNIALRGATGNPEDVVLVGKGMANADYETVPHGILVSAVADLLIANLTIKDVYFHPIHFQGGDGCQRPHVYNCRLIDAGEQFIKVNPKAGGDGVDGGIVEYTVMAYTHTARSWYTNGVDVIGGEGWTIRHCLFRNICAPADSPRQAGAAVLMWKGSRDTICEANRFVNCEWGIAFGLDSQREDDHAGGVIRNNMIYRAPDRRGDVGIAVWNSAGTRVFHNTVILSDTYPNAIEYRFPATKDCVISYNLCDANIAARDNATAALEGNVTTAPHSWFVNVTAGDLHLRASAQAVMNRARPIVEVPTDFDGEPRPFGNAADIGADEYHLDNDQ